jgi:hypothetical protein
MKVNNSYIQAASPINLAYKLFNKEHYQPFMSKRNAIKVMRKDVIEYLEYNNFGKNDDIKYVAEVFEGISQVNFTKASNMVK